MTKPDTYAEGTAIVSEPFTIREEGKPLISIECGQPVSLVKPLVWSSNWGITKAETPIGHYFIEPRRDGGFDCRLEDQWCTWASSEGRAKEAAQAHHASRVLSLLNLEESE